MLAFLLLLSACQKAPEGVQLSGPIFGTQWRLIYHGASEPLTEDMIQEVRIGITVAKTIAQTLNKPIFSFSTLDLLIENSNLQGVGLAILPAIKDEFTVGLYSRKKHLVNALTETVILTKQQLTNKLQTIEPPFYIVTPDETLVADCIKPSDQFNVIQPQTCASALAKWAAQQVLESKKGRLSEVMPQYSHLPNLGPIKTPTK